MAQKAFATKATLRKLATISDYLAFYTVALSKRGFRLTYFDAFAGTGEIPYADNLPLFEGMQELSAVIEGSARRSLKVEPPFDRYIFADSKRQNVTSLSRLKDEFPQMANRIEVLCGDANQLVRNFCLEEIKIYDRAVIFLDPYGNHVAWDTVKTIAAKPGIDLWYLFPAGVGVVRQMSHNAQIQKDAEESLDQMFGDHDWFSSLTEKNTQLDMLDHQSEARRKVATADATTRYMIAKMKTIFDGRVLEQWLPLGKQGGHWYSLIFAWSNPSKRASTLASRVAREIMRRK